MTDKELYSKITARRILSMIEQIYFSEEFKEYRIIYGSNGIRNLIIKDKSKAEEFITRAQELLDKTENAKDKQALTRLYNKLLKMTKHYGEVLEQAKKKLEKEDYYQFLKSLKAQGFKSDGLTPEQIKGLKSLGLINEETGTDFNFYATIFLSSKSIFVASACFI